MKSYWKLLLSLGLMIGALTLVWLFPLSAQPESDHIHYHAGFLIYIDDQLQDYSGYQYMNYTPCSEHNEKKSPVEEQIEKAHLHDNVGDVVHVHRTGAVWGDLILNSKIELPNDKVVGGYIDGVKKDQILQEPIEPYTTAVILVGESSATRSAERIDRAQIEAVEAKSELCGV